jgi:hypothetical protein
MQSNPTNTTAGLPRRTVLRFMLWAAVTGLAAGAYVVFACLGATSP